METDEDLIGLGEAPSAHTAQVVEDLALRLIGMDPLDIAGIENVCVPPWQIVQNTDDSSAPWIHEPSQSLFRW